MSTHDLYSDTFPPHGTTAGYAAGCHSGGACPGKLERGQTCVQANQRYASDWSYRKAVDRGEELAVLSAQPEPDPPARKRAQANQERQQARRTPAVGEEPKPVARPKPPAPTPVVEEVPAPGPVEPAPSVAHEPSVVEPEPVELPRPRGKQVLDDAVRTLAESLELQRAIAEIGERALRTIRIEINHMRREAAALENQQEKR
jgi:hypothetical protein